MVAGVYSSNSDCFGKSEKEVGKLGFLKMEKIKLKILRAKGSEDLPLPTYMSPGAAGMDLYASIGEEIVLKPREIKMVPTGIYIALPKGYEAQVRPRSGLALKYGITVLNTPGTIDSDYRGEVGVILINLGDKPFKIKRGDRIAQMTINKIVKADLQIVKRLPASKRNAGGFGHSGISDGRQKTKEKSAS